MIQSKRISAEQMGWFYWNNLRFHALKEIETKLQGFVKASEETKSFWLEVHAFVQKKTESAKAFNERRKKWVS